MPNSAANLSAISFKIPLRSPSIVLLTFLARPLKKEPIDVAVGVEPDEVVVVGMRL